ncbi:DUF2254 domain-containing protein [Stappia sp. F7233]|uniref:DUF2254 domain-containing protein n=1 Tax=Stappia albiluteola TaxID=2758565 RepID=A0A839AHZ2_9HYPH|nr:DUF2254 domain-containing protein [Stappia albiluteola]MBA5778648.1 DUF2254 domain-containing protein [Stappia albiluteola]
MQENRFQSLLESLRFRLSLLRERLWIRPLLYCLTAVAATLLAGLADRFSLGRFAPVIAPSTVEKLLTILSSSMLAVATFAVSSMVAAYASASSTASPRAFSVVVSDDASKTALSSFVGAFIFSTVGVIAVQTGFYERAGLFVLFLLTLCLFAWVVLTFIRWVDRIARLGRMGHTIAKVEDATERAFGHWKANIGSSAAAADGLDSSAVSVMDERIGFVQNVDFAALQAYCEEQGAMLTVAALPGTFCTPERPIAHIQLEDRGGAFPDVEPVRQAFVIGDERTFHSDPRFGLIVLSEIAARALSPSVNDPGTAIAVIGSFTRLFADWEKVVEEPGVPEVELDRVVIPPIAIADMFEDAFLSLSRDGAPYVEVGLRLQRCFSALETIGNEEMKRAARDFAQDALRRAERALRHPGDMERLKRAAPAGE